MELARALRERGYAPDGPGYPPSGSGHPALPLRMPGGERVVAKHYGDGHGEVAYTNMQAAWQSSFGERRRPPGLPRPLDYVPDLDVLVMERLDGRRFADLDPPDDESLDRAIRLIASLHESDARPQKLRDSWRIARSVRRKAAEVEACSPGLGVHFREVADALDAAPVADRELRPAHGDCTPGNVFVAADRMLLIDWDRFQSADPARDVAQFGSWYWVRALLQGAGADWSMLARAMSMYEAAHPGAGLDERMDFHVAAALMRLAHFLAAKGGRADLVPRVAAEALRRVG